MSTVIHLKDSQSLLKTESLHTYFSILFIQEMLLEGWLVVGVPWMYVKHWLDVFMSLSPDRDSESGSRPQTDQNAVGSVSVKLCLPRREKSVSKQVLEGEHVLPALEWTRSQLKLENFFFFLHHCDETWGPFSAVGATLVDTACLRGPGKGTWWNTALGSWDPDEPSLTAAGEGQHSQRRTLI